MQDRQSVNKRKKKRYISVCIEKYIVVCGSVCFWEEETVADNSAANKIFVNYVPYTVGILS